MDEINMLKKLAIEYANTEAGAAFNAQINFLINELALLGYDISDDKPLPIEWIDVIIIGDIKAEISDINILAEEGSLIGTGTLNASKNAPKIEIINNSPSYLRLNDLIIPDREGGRLIFNRISIIGGTSAANSTINTMNKTKTAEFDTVNTIGSSSESPTIRVENTYVDQKRSPDIQLFGRVANVGSFGNKGKVTIKSTGGVSSYSTIDAGDLTIDASGNFSQSYTDTFFNVGGNPRENWSDVANALKNIWGKNAYPANWVLESYLRDLMGDEVYDQHLRDFNQLIGNALNTMQSGSIKADNIFIAARYINVNGHIEAGKAKYDIVVSSDLMSQILFYKLFGASGNYKNYLLEEGDGYKLYFDPVSDAIVLEPITIRGGYVELYGHIINTGIGSIEALDGYGTINVDNQTSVDLIIKGLDTGAGGAGLVVITDTSNENANGYLVTRYKSLGNQIEITSWRTEAKGSTTTSTTSVRETTHTPTSGWRFEWVIGQSNIERKIETYRSKSWLGIDWLAKDPDNLFETQIWRGEPRLMPDGEYLVYRPGDIENPYTYRHESRTESEEVKIGYRNWSEQLWFLAPVWYYEEYTYQRGTIDVYYHSIKADLPFTIRFTGNREKGTINVNSNNGGSVIVDGNIKNQSGKTTINTNGRIEGANDSSIISKDIDLIANTGIGTRSPINIEQMSGGVLNATTNSGGIDIVEVAGSLNYNLISAGDGRIRIEAQTGIGSANSSSYIGGKLIELITHYGSIGTRDNYVKVKTIGGEGSGISAMAQDHIYLEGLGGPTEDLRIIKIESKNGDVYISAPYNLISGNPRAYEGNDGLLDLWEGNLNRNLLDVMGLLQDFYIKRLTDTNYWQDDINIIGKNISLTAGNNIGYVGELRIDLAHLSLIDSEIATILAGANRGDVETSGLQLIIKLYHGLGIEATGVVNVNAGNTIDIYSKEEVVLEKVRSSNNGRISIKSHMGIKNGFSETLNKNIIGGDIILEAANGSIGTEERALNVNASSLILRSSGDIYLYSWENNDLYIDFIYTPGHLSLVGASGIRSKHNYRQENIVANSAIIRGKSIGTNDNFLKVDMLNDGVISSLIGSGGGIYLEAPKGNLNVGNINRVDNYIVTPGYVALKAAGNITDIILESDYWWDLGNIHASGISLESTGGSIGRGDMYLRLAIGEGGTLNAKTVDGDIYLEGIRDDFLVKGSIETINGNIYLSAPNKNLIIGGLVKSENGSVNLSTSRSIVAYGSDQMITAKNISLSATGGGIGTSDKYLKISSLQGEQGTLTLSSQSKDEAFLDIGAKNLYIATMVSDEGSISIDVTGDITRDSSESYIKANNIILVAGGSIGAEDKYLNLKANSLEAEAREGSIYINNTGDLTVSKAKAKGKINIETGGNLSIGRVESESRAPISLKSGVTINLVGEKVILGGDLILEVDQDLGSKVAPFIINLVKGATLRVIGGGNIYLKDEGDNDLLIDYISADGDVTLISTKGIEVADNNNSGNILVQGDLYLNVEHIGSYDKPLKIKVGGKIDAIAIGNIHIEGIEGDLKVDSVETEYGDVYVSTTTNAGDIRIGKVTAPNGNIGFNNLGSLLTIENMKSEIITRSISLVIADRDIAINILDIKDGNVQLKSYGEITIDEIKANGDVTLVADLGNIISTKIIAEDGDITITAKGSIKADEIKGASIALESREGHINIDLLEANIGNITLKASLGNIRIIDIRAQNGGINLEAKKLITDNNTQPLLAKNISLMASEGSIGNSDNYMIIGSEGQTTLTVLSLGDIFIKKDGGDLILKSLVSEEGSVYLIAGGSITSATSEEVNIKGKKANLTARGSIGSLGEFLKTKIGHLTAIAANTGDFGGIWINNEGSLTTKKVIAKDDIQLNNKGDLYISLFNGERAFITSDGNVKITATGDITIDELGSRKDIIIESTGAVKFGILESRDGFAIDIKSANGIYKKAGINEETINIIGGNLSLEGGLGSIGAAQSVLKLKLTNNPIINATSGGDIYLNNISGDDISIELVSAPGHVSLKTASGIKNNRNDAVTNIAASSLDIGAKYIASNDKHLNISLKDSLKAQALEDIYIKNSYPAAIEDVLQVEFIKTENGNIFFINEGNFIIESAETKSGSIQLQSGGYIQAGPIKIINNGNIHLIAGGSISADTIGTKLGDIVLTGQGPITVNSIRTESGNVSLTNTAGDILIGKVTATDGTITLIAKGSIKGKEGQDYRLSALNIGASSEDGSIYAYSFEVTGYIDLKAILGNIYIGNVVAQIENKGHEGDISLEAKRLIVDNNTQPLLAKKIRLVTTEGQIGNSDNYFNIGGEGQTTLTVLSLGDIFIKKDGGDLILKSLVSSEGSVYLIAGGSITSATSEEVNIKGNQADLVAGSHIGGSDTGNYLRTEIGNLTAIAARSGDTGGIWINNEGSLTTKKVIAKDDIQLNNKGDLYISLFNGERAFITSDGNVKITATGDITIDELGSRKDIIIESTGTVNIGILESRDGFAVDIKSANGIYKKGGVKEETINIVGGNLTLDGGSGSIGTSQSPFRLKLTNNPIINATSGEDIYLNNISGDDINIELVSAPGHVSLKTLGGIKDNPIDALANIKAGSLDIEGKYLGTMDEYLGIDIDGTINIIAGESIYLRNLGSSLQIGTIQSNEGGATHRRW